MLIDREILAAVDAGDLLIEPGFNLSSRIQPASLDVRLGNRFGVRRRRFEIIDPKVDSTDDWLFVTVSDHGHFTIGPGELVLAATLESVGLADTLLARVEGKSSLGRLGLMVHATAGFIDPGWALAPITLELSVLGGPMKLYPGMPVAQLAFQKVEPVSSGYSGKYVGQGAPTPSRFHENWTGTVWT